jgi:acyl-CoA thioester hydrolase
VALTLQIQLRYADLDTQGHVNNAAFMALFESARMRFMRTTLGKRRPADWAVMVARVECDYLAPMLLRSEFVDCEIEVVRFGRTSFTLRQRMCQKGVECAVATVVLVRVDPQSHLPMPLSELERELLTAQLAES